MPATQSVLSINQSIFIIPHPMAIRKPQFSEDQEETNRVRNDLSHIISARTAASVIGIGHQYIGHLCRKGLLRSLGSPNGDLAFAKAEICALENDIARLAKIKRAVEEYNAQGNARKRRSVVGPK